MRILLDMQGAQSESRFRGIGRYTLSFAKGIIHNRKGHEIFLALNGRFPDTIEMIRAAFDGLLPQRNMRVWNAPAALAMPGKDKCPKAAEILREAFLTGLAPDVIHLSSLFEGFGDSVATGIGCFDRSFPVTVTLYDLIPLANPDCYLSDPGFARMYMEKTEYLKRAALCLAISEFSRREGMDLLKIPKDRIVTVSSAAEPWFRPLSVDEAEERALRRKFHLTGKFIFSAGGAEERKNLSRLIQAFAALPERIRRSHQLLLAGKMAPEYVAEFKRAGNSAGLGDDDLLFPGYVSDEDIVRLYNLCALYVFPSWHEGFGLPALEAMACGAPVIGAGTSSLPEVIGLEEALFNPFDVSSIRDKIARALEDEAFRKVLRNHGLRQAQSFSWDETARRAIVAWESIETKGKGPHLYLENSFRHRRLIQSLAGALADASSGLVEETTAAVAQNESSALERQILVDVSELCRHDAATGVQRVVKKYLGNLIASPPADFRIEPVYAVEGKGYRYARAFTVNFLEQKHEGENPADDPVQWQRGDIFFGLDMQHHLQLANKNFFRQLRSEGVTVKFLVHDLLPIQLPHLFRDSDLCSLHEQWLKMIAACDGAICVSKATADAYRNWLGENAAVRSANFSISWVHNGSDIDGRESTVGMPENGRDILESLCKRPALLSVGTLEPRKMQEQILHAVQLLWNDGADVSLVLAGREGWMTESFAQALRSHPELGERLFWLQGVSDEFLQNVYGACTCLIAASLNEGFGLPVVEAARNHLPVIARDIPVFREVAGDGAFYFSGATAEELAEVLKKWFALYAEGLHPRSGQIKVSTWKESSERLKGLLTEENYPRRQLLVDLSELALRDAGSGVQRVVRSILREWMLNPPEGWRVEPVYASVHRGYRYARRFSANFHGREGCGEQDDPIDYSPGDIFIGLDFQPQVVSARRAFFQEMRRIGVGVYFVVYDLLPVGMPGCFPPEIRKDFLKWLPVVAESHGAFCISRAVAGELANWVKENGPDRNSLLRIDWFHLGSDGVALKRTRVSAPGEDEIIPLLRSRPSFLMVGTVEPRKGHSQGLEAFNQLWGSGEEVSLVIVGRQGWMVDSLAETLRSHPEKGKRLFWLEGIGDAFLEKVYDASICLLALSEGEGFGLPLVEAAWHKLPIIARDIPVFREIAGEHAMYFSARDGRSLGECIRKWMELQKADVHPRSDDMPRLTWQESARQLLGKILQNAPGMKISG